MSEQSGTAAALKGRSALATIGIVVLIFIVWLFFFFHYSSKLTTYKNQQSTLQSQISQETAKLQTLKRTVPTTSKLTARLNTLKSYIASKPGFIFTYNLALITVVKASKVHFVQVTYSPAVSSKTTSSASVATSSTFVYYALPVSLEVTGTYDNMLLLVKNIYAMHDLTTISGLQFNGGGPGTHRGTTLTLSLTMDTYTTVPPITTNP